MTPPDGTQSTGHPVTSETIEVLLNRRSIRKYSDKPVTDEQAAAILEAAFRAPTSSNLQAYSVVQVRDTDTKARLAEIARGQKHIIDCPLFLAFCADLTRVEAAFKKNGHDLDDNNLEMCMVSAVDAALVGMSAYLAADSLGIQGVMIGAMRNDPEAVADLLGLPSRVFVVFGMCLGYPAEAPQQKPRMQQTAIQHLERYDLEGTLAAADAYDAELKAHYDSIGKQSTDDSWSHDVDAKFSKRPRQGLREALRKRGFDFK
ncbi:MAG: NADPH-dependent oxidoreductase [Rhodospirillaceae bacterium]